MRRREFIAALGSVAMWPLTAAAQMAAKRPLVAWLSLGGKSGASGFVDAFLQGMREHGYQDGRDVDFVYRFAEGYIERLPALAAELAQLHPDVILAPASGPAVAAKKVSSTIPIVTAALADGVHLGLIASEAHPGGNVTGIEPYIAGLPTKQIELAREIVPTAQRVGLLTNMNDPKGPPQIGDLKAACQGLGLSVVEADVSIAK